MSEINRLPNTSVSNETGFLNRQWKSSRFFLAKRAFESKLEGILRAAAGHEGNSLPAGDSEYELLSTEANKVVVEFANRWRLDVDLLKARIPGLAKLEGLAVPPPKRNWASLAGLVIVAIPLIFFLMGMIGGLMSLGFHLAGGK